ncbi:exodeoxyribonuclease VII large subunit [Bauldia litoralis]|uniref:Exodeoxyribonuclease 7 large subunit n=1 Tax=Bauldia litoralis TaxID=665467 RepID=A0A1G6CP19_9HYPH|nr:exodeoxyribonuclease VII large subunit [Bauldia litoralis]SDB34594.1 Exodeoxyribonuclease VII large subunit [Bauldia litoralis]
MSTPAKNVIDYSVSEISGAVKRAVEDGFSYVRVRGEISGFRGQHSSGHCYFSLKDDKARLEAVVWRTAFGRLKFKPEEGIEVIATGRLTTFPGQSKYQIVIDALEPAGIGALMALLEDRRKKLTAEGLFDDARKRPLPYLPRVIGVVTSPTGAVIRDILHRLADRFPVQVLVWPVRVQGDTSAAEVAAAIRGFNALAPTGDMPRPDVIIVARGGGSLEDLWSFNEEVVVRAAADSTIPLISAVGHETDWTLIDQVSDRRAPTPTAAAEIAVPVRSELLATVDTLAARHRGAAGRLIESARRDLLAAARALPRADDLLAIPRRSLDDLGSRLGRGLIANARTHRVAYERSAARLSVTGLERFLAQGKERVANLDDRSGRALRVASERRRADLAATARRLRPQPIREQIARDQTRLKDAATASERCLVALVDRNRRQLGALDQLLRSLSYRNVLARGFALVRAGDRPIHAAGEVASGAALDIEFHDGHVSAVATSGGPARKPPRKPPGPSGTQGSLF